MLFTIERVPVFIENLSKLSKVFNTAIPHVFVATLHRFNLGRFNKHTAHSLIQAINKILNGTYEQLSNHSICPLNFTVSPWKRLSECAFQPDLCQDFSQGILVLANVTWDNVKSLSDIEVCGTCCFIPAHRVSSIGEGN